MIPLIRILSSYRRDRGTAAAGGQIIGRPAFSRDWGELHGPATKAMAGNHINTEQSAASRKRPFSAEPLSNSDLLKN